MDEAAYMMTSAAHHDPYSGMAILPNGAPIPPHPAAAAAAGAAAAPYLHSHHPGLIDAMQHQVNTRHNTCTCITTIITTDSFLM